MVTVTSSRFFGTTATFAPVLISRGSASFQSCNFSSNTAMTDIAAGIYISNSTVSILACLFEDNIAATSGAAVTMDSGSYVTITSSTFHRNYATSNAGAIYALGGTTIITSCVFRENTAGSLGGAVASSSGNNMTITSSRFTLNQAPNSFGGAVSSSTGSTLSVSNTFFDQNYASSGGALVLATTFASIRSCNFTLNVADQFGGALLSLTPAPTNVSISNSRFISNSADRGGALSLQTSYSTITDTTFTSNVAYVAGGAIQIVSSTGSSRTTVSRSLLNSNVSPTGGALAMAPNCFLETFRNNFANNSAPGGSAGCLIHSGVWSDVGSSFTGNTAGSGAGCVFTNSGANTTLVSSFARLNSATTGGGFLYVNSSTVYVTSSTLSANVASSGGAVYATSGGAARSELFFTNVTLSDNRANYGGAVRTMGANLRSYGSRWIGNGVDSFAGAAALVNFAEILFIGDRFESNFVAGPLGAGAVFGGAMLVAPLNSGGRMHVNGSTFVVNAVAVSSITDTGFGGAICTPKFVFPFLGLR